jgi:phospholipid/cholesterol/gamma-HCH transport system substrate-binding protein
VVEDVGILISEVSRFNIEVYYRGELQFTHGGDPKVQFSGKNIVGLRVKPRPDYWYVIELVDDPQGDFKEEVVFRETAAGLETIREVRRTDSFQFTFMFAKRFRDLILRLGVKENGGGIGADLLLADDRVKFGIDIYDFTYASYPDESGIPNIKFSLDVEPVKHVYLTFGADNIVNGARRGQFTWFLGAGVWFTDNDLKWIAGSMPL